MKVPDNVFTAVNVLSANARGSFDCWNLAGDSFASTRAAIMSELRGHRVPQSRSGVLALRSEFFSTATALGASLDGSCIAERDEQFFAWCREVLANPATSPNA